MTNAIDASTDTQSEGPIRVLIIDATGNTEGFEHDTSTAICANLTDRGVTVVDNSVKQADCLRDFLSSFKNKFNTLLLFAHGCPPSTRPDEAQNFLINGAPFPWLKLKNTGIDLTNKHVFLCVCRSFNQDMVDALIRSELFASPVVAPEAILSAEDAKVFFPNVISGISQYATLRNTETVELFVKKYNKRIAGIMKVYPSIL